MNNQHDVGQNPCGSDNVTDSTDLQKSGFIYAFATAIVSGAATVVGKWNMVHISPLAMNAAMFVVASTVLSFGILPFRKHRPAFRLTRQGWLWLTLFTLSSQLAVYMYWSGVQKMDPSLASFLNRAEVPVAILMGILFLHERFNRIETLGTVLSLAGIVIMRLTLRAEYTDGFWYVLVGSLFFGITEFISKIAVRHVQPLILTYLRNSVMAVVYSLILFGSGGTLDGIEVVWPGVIAIGFLGPIMSRVMYLQALKRMELSKVAVISQSQPVFTVLLALTVLAQLPTLREVLGGICLMAGSLFMVLGRYRFNNRRATA